ncbi:MAG: UPF0280 family protein [Desulfobacterales bacterium]
MSHHHPVAPMARSYRLIGGMGHLQAFQVRVQETDLHVQAAVDLSPQCRNAVIVQRGYLEAFIREHPGFLTSLMPWPEETPAPRLIAEMIAAGARAGVGPMAAVAGALAEHVGRELLAFSDEVIIENGGDVYLAVKQPVTMCIEAGTSPLGGRVGLHLDAAGMPLAVCTSSGTIGHSHSYGRADAVCIVARQGALADAAATAVANRIRRPDDLTAAIEFACSIEGLSGVLAICQDRMGAWGDVEVVPLNR